MENARSLAAVHTHTHTHTILCKLANNGAKAPLINMQKTVLKS